MRTTPPLPLPVNRALAAVGRDIRNARIRRRITAALLAERAFITRTTLLKVERGDPGVSLGIFATVLYLLGFNDRLMQLASLRNDEVGAQLEEERLPRRVRVSRGRKPV